MHSSSRKSCLETSSTRALSASTEIFSACLSALIGNSVAKPYEAIVASTFMSKSSADPTRRSIVTTAALLRVGYSVIRATTTSPSKT